MPFDLKLAFIIREQSTSGSKFLHKSSFEESGIGSPVTRGKLDPIRESIEFEQLAPHGLRQEALGRRVLSKDWERRW